jgi:large subunit ribosomal protein L9
MQVILLERVGRLGNMGDKVTVKDGYARNFLLPRSMAVRATAANLEQFETKRAALEAENAKKRADAVAVAAKHEGVSITIVRQASEDGKLYGSVTARDIEEALAAKGFVVARQQVVIAATIKTLGDYTVNVQLHPEVALPVAVSVARNTGQSAAAPAPAASAEDEAAA